MINSLVELAQAIEEKRLIEIQSLDEYWELFDLGKSYSISVLNALILNKRFRIKPEPKVIDLSVLIESGIDCEFSGNSEFNCNVIGKLSRIIGNGYFEYGTFQYDYCRPRMAPHIHYWGGGECPLPAGLRVRVYYRNGEDTCKMVTTENGWVPNTGNPYDIIGVEILDKADNWLWPWEAKEQGQ